MPINRHDYALVIGIDDYPQFRSLRGAKNDAERFADWLTDTAIGGGLPPANCRLVLSAKAPVRPTFEEVNDALKDLYDASRADHKRRRFYFYFAGHGQTGTASEVNLCLAEWSMGAGLRIALAYSEWESTIVDCTGFEEVFFLLDCCRTRVHGGGGMPPLKVTCAKPQTQTGETFVAYATEFQNQSFEAERGVQPGSGDPIYGGHFTEALIMALTGGAATDGGGVRAPDLKRYMEQWTPRLAQEATNPEQRAIIKNGLSSIPEDPVLGAAEPTGTLQVEIPGTRPGPIHLLAPDGSLVEKGGPGVWQVPGLRYGQYTLLDTANGEEKVCHFQPRDPMRRSRFD
ncbi:caspase family protein [Ectothiorhodospiraceae bacterium WFHF3C12]|nr:caspase family protein [Ectothiorhodospiraceae bacterium WFHF3C12]